MDVKARIFCKQGKLTVTANLKNTTLEKEADSIRNILNGDSKVLSVVGTEAVQIVPIENIAGIDLEKVEEQL